MLQYLIIGEVFVLALLAHKTFVAQLLGKRDRADSRRPWTYYVAFAIVVMFWPLVLIGGIYSGFVMASRDD